MLSLLLSRQYGQPLWHIKNQSCSPDRMADSPCHLEDKAGTRPSESTAGLFLRVELVTDVNACIRLNPTTHAYHVIEH